MIDDDLVKKLQEYSPALQKSLELGQEYKKQQQEAEKQNNLIKDIENSALAGL
jgi:hypothetical protein